VVGSGERPVSSIGGVVGSVRPWETGAGDVADLGPGTKGSETVAFSTIVDLGSGSAGMFAPSKPERVSFKK